jgi:hypothetical protein
MLYALPEGFPTPEARDGKGLAKALGDAAARWMRGEYGEALGRMHAAVVIAATERATNARIDRLEKVVEQLDAWISARDRGEDVPPPSLNESFVISVDVPDKPATERRSDTGNAPATMSIASRDMEVVRPSPSRAESPSAIAHRPFSTTLEQASRPTPPPADPPPVQLEPPRRVGHGETLPEGAFPSSARADLEELRRAWQAKEAAKSAGTSLDLKKTAPALSDPFAGLDATRTPSAEPHARAANEPPIAEGSPVTVDAKASKDDEEKPQSKISTQRFVPPTTRRPADDEVYPPILPSSEDDDD